MKGFSLLSGVPLDLLINLNTIVMAPGRKTFPRATWPWGLFRNAHLPPRTWPCHYDKGSFRLPSTDGPWACTSPPVPSDWLNRVQSVVRGQLPSWPCGRADAPPDSAMHSFPIFSKHSLTSLLSKNP